MPTTLNYAYGQTGLPLTPDQLAGLAKAENLVKDGVRTAPGTGKPVYDFVLGLISHVETTYDSVDSILIPVQSTVRNANVDPAVFDWVTAALKINDASSSAGALIAGYTSNVYKIRTGTTLDTSALYTASNNIALSLASGIRLRVDPRSFCCLT